MSIQDKEISHKIVEETAKLARIAISDDEKQNVSEKLEKILEMYHVMEDCDTSSVELTDSQVYLVEQLRLDEVTEQDITSHFGDNFKQFNSDSHHFEVPKVIED